MENAGVVAGIVIACIGVTAGLAALLYFKLRPAKVRKQESAGVGAPNDKKQPLLAEEDNKTLHSMFQMAGESVPKLSRRQQQQRSPYH